MDSWKTIVTGLAKTSRPDLAKQPRAALAFAEAAENAAAIAAALRKVLKLNGGG